MEPNKRLRRTSHRADQILVMLPFDKPKTAIKSLIMFNRGRLALLVKKLIYFDLEKISLNVQTMHVFSKSFVNHADDPD